MEHAFYDNFLGPQAENQMLLRNALCQIVDWHSALRRKYYTDDGSIYPSRYQASEHFHTIFDDFLKRLEKQPPYFSARYAAQMLKDPSLPSIIGYVATMLSNPNNHAYEGGPVTTEMEVEVIDDLLRMCGFRKGWGHLTSGGSLANLEAMWAVRDAYAAKSKKPGQVMFSNMSHYSWKRNCAVLGIQDFKEIHTDDQFRMDIGHLEKCLKKGRTMMVIANIGTTGCGAVDDLESLLRLRNKYGFHLHADAAYGGYARSIIYSRANRVKRWEDVRDVLGRAVYDSLRAIEKVDSITVDPHKHGAVGYGCGAILYKEERLQKVILNTAPYTYHVKNKPNLGTFSLEGSRPGAAAAACWLSHRLIPLNEEGYGKIMTECLSAAAALFARIDAHPKYRALHTPDLDIFCFYRNPGEKKNSLKETNLRNEQIYGRFSVLNPRAPFILSKFVMDKHEAKKHLSSFKMDDPQFVSLRAVLMKHWMRMGQPSFVDKLVEELDGL